MISLDNNTTKSHEVITDRYENEHQGQIGSEHLFESPIIPLVNAVIVGDDHMDCRNESGRYPDVLNLRVDGECILLLYPFNRISR
jgi:hypothetical protein